MQIQNESTQRSEDTDLSKFLAPLIFAGGIGLVSIFGAIGVSQAREARNAREAQNFKEDYATRNVAYEIFNIAAGKDKVLSTEESRKLLADLNIKYELKDEQIVALSSRLYGSTQDIQEGRIIVKLMDSPERYAGLEIASVPKKSAIEYLRGRGPFW